MIRGRGVVGLSRSTVGVMGSGTLEHDESAAPIGALIAALGANLLTGGGPGVMRAVSRAFTRHGGERGICIGIIPCASEDDRRKPKPGYPNEFVELAIRTHLPRSGPQGTDDLSRNHINVLSSAAIVALPGEQGTMSEIALAIRYGKPIVAFSVDPAAIARFPDGISRLHDVRDVERFLRAQLSDA
jgi:uncharacterized protein (TIGR00725 family)